MLTLVVDNSKEMNTNLPYSCVRVIFDWNRESSFHYTLDVLTLSGDEHRYNFDSYDEVCDAMDEIRLEISRRSATKQDIKLVYSKAPTWLELAIARVSKASSSMKKDRDMANKNITRYLR